MSREEIVETTYKSALRLNRIKEESGLIDSKRARQVEERIHGAIEMIARIDGIIQTGECTWQEEQLQILKPAIDKLSIATICGKDEIKWPTGKMRFNYINIIKDMIFRSRKLPSTETTGNHEL